MGKSNRVRAQRAAKAVKAPGVKQTKNNNGKKGLSSRAMSIIALVVTIAILLMILAFVMIGNGVPNRWRTSVESEHFDVNTNMMSYYFYTVYNNFTTQYSQYMSLFSLNPNLPLKSQPFGGANDAAVLGAFTGTWFDYFAAQTKEEVTSMLLYMEEAYARNIELTDEECAQIEASLDAAVAQARKNYGNESISADLYFSSMYGKGVCQKDVQKALEYSALASKMQNIIYEEIEKGITDEAILEKYNGAPKDFNVVDYTYYAFRVDFNEIAEETLGSNYKDRLKDSDPDYETNKKNVMDAYQKAIDEAKAKAEALNKITDEKELKKAILDIVVSEAYDSSYATEINKITHTEKSKPFYDLFGFGAAYDTAFTDEKLDTLKDSLTDAELDTVKLGLIKEAISNAMANDTETDANSIIISAAAEGTEKTATAYGKKVPVAFAEALMKVRTSIAKVAEENFSAYRAQMIKEAIDAALADKDDEKAKSFIVIETKTTGEGDAKVTETTATIFEKTVPTEFAQALEKTQTSLNTKATSGLTTYVQDKVGYNESDEFLKWAFDTAKKAGETTVIINGDGKVEEGKELSSDVGYTYVEAYTLRSLPRKDEDKTRNVAYALFTSEENAMAAITGLVALETMDLAGFESVVQANGSTGNTTIDNCHENQVGSTTFDNWLFDEDLKVGAYTLAPLSLDSSNWAVAYYTSEGDAYWKVAVKDAVLYERQETQYKEMQAKYGAAIQANDKAISKINEIVED